MGIGILGCGRLGGLLIGYLTRDFKVYAFDTRPLRRRIISLGGIPASLQEACAQRVVILCVPIREFESVLRRARGLLRPGALVVDTCSVKAIPVRLMKRLLPRGVEILAAHPSFGPDSAAKSLRGRKIILCPVRLSASRYAKIKRYLKQQGLELIEATPREHDRQMARSLVLTHFIGRALIRIGAKEIRMDTEGYRRLMRILQTVQNDTWELFSDMNRFNPYAPALRRDWLKAVQAIDAKLGRNRS